MYSLNHGFSLLSCFSASENFPSRNFEYASERRLFKTLEMSSSFSVSTSISDKFSRWKFFACLSSTMTNNFCLALVKETKSILRDSSVTSSSGSIPFAPKMAEVISSIHLLLSGRMFGMYITMSNALPFALCTVVSVVFSSLLRSKYDSSPMSMKSKSPSKVGVSNVRYSSICCSTDTAVENHSEPFETHNG